jgi:hypothetical protein
LSVVITVVACSGETGNTSTTTSPASTTTTAAATTTTTVAVTTTVAAPTTTVTADTLAADGSGCTPGPGALPDGRWYGLVDSYDAQGIAFDLACWFSGEAAIAASAEDGEESPPPNDYYVRNENTQLRDLPVDPATPVLWYLGGDPNDFEEGVFSDWIEHLDTMSFRFGIWVTIEEGQVTEIEEQWVP